MLGQLVNGVLVYFGMTVLYNRIATDDPLETCIAHTNVNIWFPLASGSTNHVTNTATKPTSGNVMSMYYAEDIDY